MKIKMTDIKTNNAPAFTSTRVRWIKTLDGKINKTDGLLANNSDGILYCNYTNLAREDYNWEKLPRLLNDRFGNQDKVKTNIFGGSDGSDGYTFVINMIKTLGNKAKKFFPVFLSDVSTQIVKNAQEGKILLHQRDIDYLKIIGIQT